MTSQHEPVVSLPGMKDCSSTLDTDPHARCRKKVKVGELFCELHEPFPDLGRRAAIYADECKRRGEKPTLANFMAAHYPGSKDAPDICVSQSRLAHVDTTRSIST